MAIPRRLEAARERLSSARNVAVLTGAGVSAASGLATFRDADGLWNGARPEELASPGAYARDAQRVWAWYAWRYARAVAAAPNRAHALLAELEGRVPPEGFLLVTQNVDGLHARAGSRRVVELHGNLMSARCEHCGRSFPLPPPEEFRPPPLCPHCLNRGRPNVVWFGERLPTHELDRATRAFLAAEVALVVGTSAVVEPAASLGRLAKRRGAFLIEVNPNETPLSDEADLSLRDSAVDGLERLLG